MSHIIRPGKRKTSNKKGNSLFLKKKKAGRKKKIGIVSQDYIYCVPRLYFINMILEEKVEIILSDFLIPVIWGLLFWFLSLGNLPVFFTLLLLGGSFTFAKHKLKYAVEKPKLIERIKHIQGEQIDNVKNNLRVSKIKQYDQDVSGTDKETTKQVFISDNVREKLNRLEGKTKEKFGKVIDGLSRKWTSLVNISKLKDFKGMFILRLGKNRIIYRIENDKIIILDFFERSDLGLREHGLLQKLLSLRKKIH